MDPKGANLDATDLLEISEVSGSGYITKSITGQEIIDAASGGAFVPYTGATANVDLGTFHLDAGKGTFNHNGSTDTLTANHTSGSGIGLLITKGGSNEGLKVNKTSGSGNAATIIGTLEATTLVKTGGLSTQFLMADGSTSLGGGGITVGTTAVTSGTIGRVFFEGTGNVVQQSASLFWDNTNSRLGVGATPASTVRLDVRAQGALSTDIAFRVRNSADTLNTIQSTGDGKTRMQGSTYYTEFDPTNGLYIGNNFGNQWNLTGVLQGTSWMLNGVESKLALGKTSASYRLDIQTNSTPINGVALRLDTSNSQLNGSTGMAFTNTWTGGAFGNIGGILKMKHTHLGGSGVFQNCQFDFDLNYNNSTPTTRASITGRSNILIGAPTENIADSHTIYIPNGTVPAASIVDGYKQYSADITAGNAAPHFRTENGAIVKVYQETTAVVASTLATGLGTPLTDTDTFDGYTLKQIVKALRNQGLLA
jgi:hypothetical protein